eukprot:GFUD01016365.1.p1 GENE.GFUD01016365.1~~GFUD01016365.1.p1  ORF type:complete len:693 (-),score=250.90 GFUD01016365.1:3063-5141(-)
MVADGDQPATIIYPPPEVRNIVDKTAGFVARNGIEFEQRIKQNEINNPKFNFLNTGDPYHAYYQHRVVVIREGKAEPEKIKSLPTESVAQKQSELLKSVTKEDVIVPKEPPPEYEFLADPPSISAFDLDVVKLTAQFVARNGRQFLTNLMNREQRNFQFDFLRPQHSLFQYFTKLLEQYTKVLIPPKDLQNKLNFEADNRAHVLEQVQYRVAWLQHQEAARRKQEEALERERVSYAQVDWHNFVVVETVDYQPWEVGNFPPPTNPGEVGARVLIQRRQEETGVTQQPPTHDSDDSDDETGADTNVQDMEEGSSSDESEDEEAAAARAIKNQQVMSAPPVQQPQVPPIQAPTPGNVTIKKYDPKAAAAIKKRTEDDQYLISPITGEKIPASKAAEHMKVGLLDPRWVEERDKHISAKANEEVVFAPGQSIESSLKQLAERRTDIFGVGEEAAQETAIGQKMGEEEKLAGEKVTWDGHSSSAEAAARAARANISLDDQIAQIHRQKGLIPDQQDTKTVVVAAPPQPVQQQVQMGPPMIVGVPMRPAMVVPTPVFVPTRQMAPVYIQQQQQQQQQPMDEDEPASKRQRTEENLIPEGEFLARNLSPVTFKVMVPQMPDKPEWKLDGQILTLTLQLTDTVNTIKQRIMEELGMPQGKQKLQHESIFFKDANSLAYYNVTPGTMLNLQLKERGGRKK